MEPQKVQAIKTEKGSQPHDWLQLLVNPIDNGACQSHPASECLVFHDLWGTVGGWSCKSEDKLLRLGRVPCLLAHGHMATADDLICQLHHMDSPARALGLYICFWLQKIELGHSVNGNMIGFGGCNFSKGWLSIAKLKPLSLFISLF